MHPFTPVASFHIAEKSPFFLLAFGKMEKLMMWLTSRLSNFFKIFSSANVTWWSTSFKFSDGHEYKYWVNFDLLDGGVELTSFLPKTILSDPKDACSFSSTITRLTIFQVAHCLRTLRAKIQSIFFLVAIFWVVFQVFCYLRKRIKIVFLFVILEVETRVFKHNRKSMCVGVQ